MADANSTCRQCSAPFIRTHGRQVYCSAECRQPKHAKELVPCSVCGNEVAKYKSRTSKRQPICSHECRNSLRYPYTKLPEDHWALRFGKMSAWPKPPEPALDRRSDLRRAIEDGCGLDVLQVIRAKSTVIANTGCWQWQGRLKDGYAETRLGGRTYAVHRLSLESKLGARLGDQPAHHMCANTACVNPDHLQPVTHRENIAEMLTRNYLERRIIALEQALYSLAPDHQLLDEIGLPTH